MISALFSAHCIQFTFKVEIDSIALHFFFKPSNLCLNELKMNLFNFHQQISTAEKICTIQVWQFHTYKIMESFGIYVELKFLLLLILNIDFDWMCNTLSSLYLSDWVNVHVPNGKYCLKTFELIILTGIRIDLFQHYEIE